MINARHATAAAISSGLGIATEVDALWRQVDKLCNKHLLSALFQQIEHVLPPGVTGSAADVCLPVLPGRVLSQWRAQPSVKDRHWTCSQTRTNALGYKRMNIPQLNSFRTP
ncbi:hypothetical protein BV20DRAFT_546047 [Pilatotrama ljubarskyi]|nr:hypothetical protein BV20DRAFT_546047 [Pilatotrama ljubarskyi]